jgi:hypothetical protein
VTAGSCSIQPMQHPSFQAHFCEHFACAPDDFEERAFRALLYGHVRLVAIILFKLKRGLFARDLKFIRYLEQAEDLREALACAADFQDANLAKRNPSRNVLKTRVSGWKATKLAEELFAKGADKERQEGHGVLTSSGRRPQKN